MASVSVVIPAYNEAASIRGVVERVRSALRDAGIDSEIVVVVDGATDATAAEAGAVADRVVEHPANLGYGRSLKTGILAAKHDLIAVTDADGTYPVERLPELVRLAERYHMVVGARTGAVYQGGQAKQTGRFVFRHLCEFAVGRSIPDINSGMRVFRKSQIVPFFPTISAGFSFTTTATLVYMLNDLFVHYVPIEYRERTGQSKVRHVRDSLRALQIIVEAILRYNPIKIFVLMAAPPAIAGLGMASLGAFWLLLANWLKWGLGQDVFGGSLFVSGFTALCASLVTLAFGFLAVAIAPQRRYLDPTTSMPPDAGHRDASRISVPVTSRPQSDIETERLEPASRLRESS